MKSRGKFWLIYLLVFVLVNLAFFLIPFNKTQAFILAWAVTVLVFVIGALAVFTGMGKKSDSGERYLGMKLCRTAVGLIAVQALATVLLGVLGDRLPLGNGLPWWLILAEAVIVLGGGILLLKAGADRTTIRKAEREAAQTTSSMHALRARAEALVKAQSSPELEKAMRRLADDLRFSDPVSSAKSRSYEDRLDTLLSGIENNRDETERLELIRRATALVAERAAIVKANK